VRKIVRGLWIALCVVSLAACKSHVATPPTSPALTVSLVPTHGDGDTGLIDMAHDTRNSFYVILTNNSQSSISTWEVSNSWGYRALSFEAVTADGEKFRISRKAESFSVNFPSSFRILPGEHQVYPVLLNGSWTADPSIPMAGQTQVLLTASYEVSQTPESDQYHVWTGHVESRPYKIALRQW